jgi:excisionase family DNA binding protein
MKPNGSIRNSPVLLGVKEVAQMTCMSERGIRELISRGILPVVHVGRRTLVRPADLEALATLSRSADDVEAADDDDEDVCGCPVSEVTDE